MIEPANEAELVEAITAAVASGRKLLLQGGGSKARVGRAVDAEILSLARISGIVDYDPSELVLTVRPGTPLAEVEAALAGQGQMLAFEPFDHGPIFATASGAATIGGIVTAGVSGARRLSAGGARDHMLGLRGVSGRGEAFLAGAKVVKNVTGYDLPKLAAGSWGRLFALSEISLKVLPKPPIQRSLVLSGLSPSEGARAMSAAMGSPAEVAAAAYLPGAGNHRQSTTLFRLEGFGPSVAARIDMLAGIVREFGRLDEPSETDTDGHWVAVRTLSALDPDLALWRINIPPRAMPEMASVIERLGGEWLADWAGGLVWAACDEGSVLREASRVAGGHTMLIRAPEHLRSTEPVFHPQPHGLAKLEERIRRAFDPTGVFETGRF